MLKNKIVVITGGSGLIGKNFVDGILSSGGIVVAADVNAQGLENLNTTYRGTRMSNRIITCHVDICDSASIKKMMERTISLYGKIDALVNNAYPHNKNYGKKFEQVEYADFCENINLHLGGYFQISKLFLEYFKQRGMGTIVNISSIYGVMAPRFEIYENTSMTVPIEYVVIKSALIHMSKYLAKYYKGSGIRVNTLSIGGIKHSQPEIFLEQYNKHCMEKGMLDPQDVVKSLLFLLSDDSQYINGQNIVIDDGFTL